MHTRLVAIARGLTEQCKILRFSARPGCEGVSQDLPPLDPKSVHASAHVPGHRINLQLSIRGNFNSVEWTTLAYGKILRFGVREARARCDHVVWVSATTAQSDSPSLSIRWSSSSSAAARGTWPEARRRANQFMASPLVR